MTQGRNSDARGRRIATKGKPRPAPAEAAPASDDIGVEARVVAGILLNAALEKRNGRAQARSQPPPRPPAPAMRKTLWSASSFV